LRSLLDIGGSDDSLNIDDRLLVDLLDELDHALRDGISNGSGSLDGGEALSEDREHDVSGSGGSVGSGSDPDLLSDLLLGDLLNWSVHDFVSIFGVALRSVELEVSEQVG
jgi:hypothetical protein